MRIALLIWIVAALGCAGGSAPPPPPPPPPIELDVDFALVRADVPTQHAVSIGNPLEGEATVELLQPPGDGFAPAPGVLPGVAAEAGDFQLPVVFDPVAGPGDHASELQLTLRDEATGRERTVIVSLRASVEEPRIRLLTPALPFGDVRVGETATRLLQVRNTSLLTPLPVSDPSPLPPEFLAVGAGPGTLGPGEVASFDIVFTPQGLGSHLFTVSVGPSLDATVTAETTTWIERQVIDFGSVTLTGGQTGWLEAEVPPHAISLSLEAVAPGSQVVALNGFEGPDGTVYENDQFTGAYLQEPGDGVFTATLPNSDRAGVQLVPGGGTYRFRLTLMSGSAAELSVRAIVLNRPQGAVGAGHLGLNVFLTPNLGIPAVDAPVHPRLQTLLGEVDRIFSQQGLRLGTVRYFDVGDPAFDDVTSNAEFGDLLELSAAAPVARVNVFFVRTALGGGVLGVAARLAGPAKNGTRVSGVMVDFDFGSDATAGYVTAHEIGHYLGLYHTADSDGSHDIIDDTAECPSNSTSAECPTLGNDYLMHWRVLSGVDPVVTDGQGRVILGHPLVDERGPPASLAQRSPGTVDELPPNWCSCK